MTVNSGYMPLTLLRPDRDACRVCRSGVEKAGFVLEDSTGTRRFLCTSHTVDLVKLAAEPLKTVLTES